MIQDNVAIQKAMDYFKSLPQEYLGSPEELRLEGIERNSRLFRVVLSYMAKRKLDKSTVLGGIGAMEGVFARQRYFKEVDVNAETGDVIAMKDPI
jgi:hypothetical protein